MAQPRYLAAPKIFLALVHPESSMCSTQPAHALRLAAAFALVRLSSSGAVWSCVESGGLTALPSTPALAASASDCTAPAVEKLNEEAAKLGLPQCTTGGWTKIDAACGIDEFDRQLVIAALRRRLLTWQERREMRELLGRKWSQAANDGYGLLKAALHGALHDPDFIRLTKGSASLWLEFGVFRGLSSNVTSKYAERQSASVDGFDTFTGLPEGWTNAGWHDSGQGGGQFVKGSFSLGGNVPPVRRNVRLHKGLFNDTLPTVLAARPSEPLAWANIDCDLYVGAIGVLSALGHRMRRGTRLHFHELMRRGVTYRFVALNPHGKSAVTWKSHEGKPRIRKVMERPLVATDETRALHEWLRASPTRALQMHQVISVTNNEAVAFRVLQP